MANDKKRNTGKGTPSKRRTSTGGGAPAQRKRNKAGNPGYAGYEYQISVTVWAALDLMVVKHAADEIVIEPRSDEDLEAAVRNPETALLGLESIGERLDLVLQAKTRSGAPWSAPAIADVLLGKDAEQDPSGKKRSRPLQMLKDEPKRRYVFVTNEATVEGLRSHEGEHLFDFPEVEELPPHVRDVYDATVRASLAPRILLLTGVTEEVLSSRIARLLERHGHVPQPRHATCLRDLRDEVRKRIKGEEGGRWTYSELLTILTRNGGSIAPTRDMDHYVRPSSFDKIRDRLDNGHAVVIAGPSGTGKTLTADILEVELRRGCPPFDVVGEEYGPGHVRSQLTRTDPVLFHLRDPWGGNRLTPGADRWTGELPKLLQSAGSGRKFLVTSRSDVLQSAGYDLFKDLRPFVVSIEVEDYGPARLAEIYDAIASDLTGRAAALSNAYKDRALNELTRPYEVKRFLVALSSENFNKPRKVEEIIADSQIDAISRVIADQLAPLGVDGVQSAALIWAMLSAQGAVSRDDLVKLVRRLRTSEPSLRSDVQGLIDFLVAGQNLRQDGSMLSFKHPRVEDGLRLAFMRRASEAEFLLSKVVDVLVAWDAPSGDWGTEAGLGVLRLVARIEELQLDLAPSTWTVLDSFLESVAFDDAKHTDFERGLRDLARFGSLEHPPSRLARILIQAGRKETEPSTVPEIGAGEKSLLRAHSRTEMLIERFIRDVLPFSYRDYHLDLVGLLDELASDLEPAYWDALDTIAGPGGPHGNIDVIVAGALTSDTPDYERAIARFVRSEAEADEWMEKYSEEYYQAEEHAVDADLADHHFDAPDEQYFNAREGMEQVVRLRRDREGVAWIANHSNARPLLFALSSLIALSRRKPGLDERELLLKFADGWTRIHAWRAIQQYWDPRLDHCLTSELSRTDIDDSGFRELLVEIAASTNETDIDLIAQLTAIALQVSPRRRLELVRDIMGASLDRDPEGQNGLAMRCQRAQRVATAYPSSERDLSLALIEILAGKEIPVVASSMNAQARDHLETMLSVASMDVVEPLACLAASAGLDLRDAAARLFSSGDARNGEVALQALLIANGSEMRESLVAALTHKRYRVRRKALRALVPDASEDERASLARLAEDQSADVRLAFAQLMGEHRWPEAIDALIMLLADPRDFAIHRSMSASWSKFRVARAAAHALGTYETLPVHAIDALIRAAEIPSTDPFVACAALSALANSDDERVLAVLIDALRSAGLNDSPSFRPRAQAASWAIFDRAIEDKVGSLGAIASAVAERDLPTIAGPLLISTGILGGPERKALLERLRNVRSDGREALVRAAAIAVDKVEGMTLNDREQILLHLSHGEEFEALSIEDRSSIEGWSRGLDTQSGFDRFSAWIAEKAFHLPVSGNLDSIRTLDLPNTIPMLTMRSLSAYGEEDGGMDDGT